MNAKWSMWVWIASLLGIGTLAYLIQTTPDTIPGLVKKEVYKRWIGVLTLIFGVSAGYFMAKNTNWEKK